MKVVNSKRLLTKAIDFIYLPIINRIIFLYQGTVITTNAITTLIF